MELQVDRSTRLLNALEAELSSKPNDYRFTAAELATIDNLHTRGYAATVDLARVVGITENMEVLDLGSGFGGPARYLAETYGCRVEGVDVEAGMVRAATYLSSRWLGPADGVNFTAAGALELPFPDAVFDLVWMQHVAMNIADRVRLYEEIRRVLRPGGRLATYDVLRGTGELIYPTPWAADSSISTVLSAQETRNALEHAGLRVTSIAFDTLAALSWTRATADAASVQRPAGAIIMRAALGDNFREIIGNLGKNYLEKRADVAAIIAERPR